MDSHTIICQRCGIESKRTSPSQKYCKDCAPTVYAEMRRERDLRRRSKFANSKIKISAHNNIKLSELAAEATRHKMTYGKYVAALRSKEE